MDNNIIHSMANGIITLVHYMADGRDARNHIGQKIRYILVLSWIITLHTLWQMVEMHEIISDKRLDSYGYYELDQVVFSQKLDLWIVVLS